MNTVADRAESRTAFALLGVGKSYGPVRAVHVVDLAFARGACTALIGSSGSGKSTVLRLLLGLEWPDHGQVLLDDQPLRRTDVLQARRRIGYVIQEGGLFPHLTVLGNLGLLPRYLGWERERIRSRACELAQLAHLPEASLKRFPAELSGGQRQRVALMRALMLDPDALLLDEPLSALDPIVRYELQTELKRIFDELGKTVILVTHDLAEAAHFSRRLILMRRGSVIQDGSYADLRDRPADEFVERFVQAQRGLPEAQA